MPNPTSNRVRGELLREWRFSQKWDVFELAKRVNLSIGQIQQLETGGTSLFYSAAIRENAARKVATLLGADPNAVIRMDEVLAAPGAESKIVDDMVNLSRQRAKAARQPSVFVRHSSFIATALVSLVGLIAAAGWLQQKWQNGGAQQFWREAAAPAATAIATATAKDEASAPLAASVAVAAPPVVVPLAAAPATLPAVAAAAATATAVADPLLVASASDLLCQQANTGHVITPARPSKAGDMVHVVAQKIGSVCVVDAAGVRTVLSLKPQEGRSVYGAAPWRVHFEQPQQAQLYFQGERLRVPGASVTTLALREASFAQ